MIKTYYRGFKIVVQGDGRFIISRGDEEFIARTRLDYKESLAFARRQVDRFHKQNTNGGKEQ